ncbi:MAG: threonine ammonia-lyase [Actinobacteria bacterium]|nr:threonine ammonia-lyase [Actinomycetota bacterium]
MRCGTRPCRRASRWRDWGRVSRPVPCVPTRPLPGGAPRGPSGEPVRLRSARGERGWRTLDLVSAAAIRRAAERLQPVLQPTPVEGSRALSEVLGGEVVLKCENLQRTGSFKLRGAYNRIALLSDAERAGGVVCASAGNHAQGVALGSALQGVDATVFMPVSAPLPKVAATQAYGATVELVGETFDEALAAARSYADERGRVFVHPFDHPDVIAGQGTIALELLAQVPSFATVLVPVGGGGLISGMAVALRAERPDVRIVGVQASGAASFPASLTAGEPTTLAAVDTIADGIAVKRPGELTLAHVRELVDEVVTVDDDVIARAVVLLLERAKLVVEPSGAAAVAAILAGGVELAAPVVAVLTGGNIDPLLMQHLVTSGLTAEGRYVTLRTRIPDRPGELARLLELAADARANVVGVEHHRFGRRLRLGQVEVVVELETRGADHVAELCRTMQRAGYPVSTV